MLLSICRYVLVVLWMAIFSHTCKAIGKMKDDHHHGLTAETTGSSIPTRSCSVLKTSYVRCSPGANFATYDCLAIVSSQLNY